MKSITVSYDGRYPVFAIVTDTDNNYKWGNKVTISDKKLKEYEKVMEDFDKMQRYLIGKYEEARDAAEENK